MCLICPYPDCISDNASQKMWFTTQEEMAMTHCGDLSRKKSEYGYVPWTDTGCWKNMSPLE